MYYPPFQAAIDAGVASFMCSYNKINQKWSCENDQEIGLHLRAYMGFKGYVMSDWGATHSVSIGAGLDQEQDNTSHFFTADGLKPYEGIPVDFAVYRIMYQLFDWGVLDDPREDNVKGDVRTEEHARLASEVATESMVLLKNDNRTLPIFEKQAMNLHLVGDQLANPVIAGGGSGVVHEKSVRSPLDELTDWLSVPKFNNTQNQTCSVKKCNERGDRCVTYTPFKDNAGGNPYRACDLDVNAEKYDYTIMAAGIESSEGADRQDLFWDNNTY